MRYLYLQCVTLLLPIASFYSLPRIRTTSGKTCICLKPLIFSLSWRSPPKGAQLIRRYGLYSSRIKGAWDDLPYVAGRVEGSRCGNRSFRCPIDFAPFLEDDSVDSQMYKRAKARYLRKSMRWTRLCARNAGRKWKWSPLFKGWMRTSVFYNIW